MKTDIKSLLPLTLFLLLFTTCGPEVTWNDASKEVDIYNPVIQRESATRLLQITAAKLPYFRNVFYYVGATEQEVDLIEEIFPQIWQEIDLNPTKAFEELSSVQKLAPVFTKIKERFQGTLEVGPSLSDYLLFRVFERQNILIHEALELSLPSDYMILDELGFQNLLNSEVEKLAKMLPGKRNRYVASIQGGAGTKGDLKNCLDSYLGSLTPTCGDEFSQGGETEDTGEDEGEGGDDEQGEEEQEEESEEDEDSEEEEGNEENNENEENEEEDSGTEEEAAEGESSSEETTSSETDAIVGFIGSQLLVEAGLIAGVALASGGTALVVAGIFYVAGTGWNIYTLVNSVESCYEAGYRPGAGSSISYVISNAGTNKYAPYALPGDSSNKTPGLYEATQDCICSTYQNSIDEPVNDVLQGTESACPSKEDKERLDCLRNPYGPDDAPRAECLKYLEDDNESFVLLSGCELMLCNEGFLQVRTNLIDDCPCATKQGVGDAIIMNQSGCLKIDCVSGLQCICPTLDRCTCSDYGQTVNYQGETFKLTPPQLLSRKQIVDRIEIGVGRVFEDYLKSGGDIRDLQ